MLQRIIVFVLLMAGPFLSSSQVDYCGTKSERTEWLKEYQAGNIVINRSVDDSLFLPMKIHITGTDEGLGYTQVADVLDAFCFANTDVISSGTNIYMFMNGDFNYIDKGIWHDHDNFGDGRDMMNANNVARSMNAYIVSNPAGNCGYARLGGVDMALKRDCIGPGSHTWAHELGHSLSLPHPFVGWEGFDYDPAEETPNFIGGELVERVDGSNCSQAADGFCDTPPDYLSYRWRCNNDSMSQVVLKDPDGTEFRSDGSLFMSYSSACSANFSDEQTLAIRANIINTKGNFLVDELPGKVIKDDTVRYQDFTSGDTLFVGNDDISWLTVKHADRYLIEVSKFPNFASLEVEQITTDTFFNAGDLTPFPTYYFRVRPFNSFHTCTVPTKSSFSLQLASDVKNLLSSGDLTISPNPVLQSRGEIQLTFENNVLINSISWTAANGKMMYREDFSSPLNTSVHRLLIPDLSNGVYFLTVYTEDGVMSNKVILY